MKEKLTQIELESPDTNLRGFDFRGYGMESINLEDCVLTGTDMRGCNLIDANLNKADMAGADLRGADLSNANFYRADLRGADLRGAWVSGTILIKADLRGADLNGVDLKKAATNGAKFEYNPTPIELILGTYKKEYGQEALDKIFDYKKLDLEGGNE